MTDSDICARIDKIVADLRSSRTWELESTVAEATVLAGEKHDFQPAGQLLLAFALANSVSYSKDLNHEMANARQKEIRRIIDRELYCLRPVREGASRTTRLIGAHMIVLDTITSLYKQSTVVLASSALRYYGFRADFSRFDYLIAEVAALETHRSGGNIFALEDLENRKIALKSELTEAIDSLIYLNKNKWLAHGANWIFSIQKQELDKNGAVLKVPVPKLDYIGLSGTS
ncbi:hypothetical protein HYV85_01035 [Candidatus Woesearchaeota archaeon]|nr:hypothetical protein [Candidatus Woesearchaeota archaeon]